MVCGCAYYLLFARYQRLSVCALKGILLGMWVWSVCIVGVVSYGVIWRGWSGCWCLSVCICLSLCSHPWYSSCVMVGSVGGGSSGSFTGIPLCRVGVVAVVGLLLLALV